jgi:hypothetical protein
MGRLVVSDVGVLIYRGQQVQYLTLASERIVAWCLPKGLLDLSGSGTWLMRDEGKNM